MNKTYDAIVFYAQEDAQCTQDLVSVLKDREYGLNVWFYPEEVYSGPISANISAALADSNVAIFCFGPKGMGAYQSTEYSATQTRAAAGKIELIPVYLGSDNTLGPSNPPNDDPFLADRQSYDLRQRVRGNPNLQKLVKAIIKASRGDDDLPGQRGEGDRAPQPKPTERIGSVVTGFAGHIKRSGLNIIVGPTWPERHQAIVPSASEVTKDMLHLFKIVDEGDDDGFSQTPLICAEHLASAVQVLGSLPTEPTHDIVSKFVAPRSLGEPLAFGSIASILKEITPSEATVGVPRGVVLTTNLDLALERGFLRHGLGFVRLIYDHSTNRYQRTDFPAAQVKDGRVVLVPEAPSYVERREEDVPQSEIKGYRQIYDNVVASSHIDFPSFFRTLELNRIIAEFHVNNVRHVGTDQNHESFEHPLLIKLLGSHRVPETCATNLRHFYNIAKYQNILPEQINLALMENASVVVGYNLTEPPFFFLNELVLSRPFSDKSSGHNQRCALLQLPDDIIDGQDRIDKAVGSVISGGYVNELEMYVFADVSITQFFEKLDLSLSEIMEDHWAKAFG